MDCSPLTRPSLLLRIRDSNDVVAWREFVELYTPLIYRHCRQHGLQDADAADVAQEVMKVLAGAIRSFEYDPARGTFRSWLFTVTRSRLNNFLSVQQRAPRATGHSSVLRLVDAQGSPEEMAAWDVDYRRRLWEWAATKVQAEVEPFTWRAFWRMAMEEGSGPEVAKELGLSVGAVYVAKSRVLVRLKNVISNMPDGSSVIPEVLR